MAWNGSDAASSRAGATVPSRPKNEPRRTSPALRLALAAAVLAALGAVLFFVLTRDAPAPEEPSAKPPAPVKASAPAPAPARKTEHPKTVEEALANVGEMPKPEIKLRELTPEEWYRATNRTYSTSTEQVMSWIFTKQLGDAPMPIPPISDEEKRNIVGILISKNPIKDTDSEKIAYSKEMVDAAKKEMQKYLAQGGDPDEFLRYYGRQLEDAYEYRSQIEHQVCDILDDGDRELAREFIKKANALLDERGIKPISERQYRALNEEEPADAPADAPAEEEAAKEPEEPAGEPVEESAGDSALEK